MRCSIVFLVANLSLLAGLAFAQAGSPGESAQDKKAPADGEVQTPGAAIGKGKDARGRFHVDAPRPKDTKELFKLFASIEGLEVEFTEDKHLRLLRKPLKSSGTLYYLRPGYLTRVVRKPKKQTVFISPEALTIRGADDQEEVIDLRQDESVRTFVTSLVRIFSGDGAALAKAYKIEFKHVAKDSKGWTLELTPRGKGLSKMIKSVQMSGRGTMVQQMRIEESNGDRTVTTLKASKLPRTFSAKERKALFRIERAPKKGKGGEPKSSK